MRTRKLIVEPNDDGYMSMDEDGNVRFHLTAVDVVRWVQRRDRKTAQRGASTVTYVEWRGVPDGFVPPQE